MNKRIDDIIFISAVIVTCSIVILSIALKAINNKFHAEKVTARYMKYCAEPIGYLKRIKATNKTTLMYLSKGNIKGAEYAIRSEDKEINRILK